MKKKYKIIFVVLLLVIFLIFLSSFLVVFFRNSNCFLSGGRWKMFSNGCGDSCEYERQTSDNPIFCTSAFEPNCDCGPLRCWNSDTQKCEEN